MNRKSPTDNLRSQSKRISELRLAFFVRLLQQNRNRIPHSQKNPGTEYGGQPSGYCLVNLRASYYRIQDQDTGQATF